MKVLLADMTWTEVKERLGPRTVVVIPTASTEQHGPHLPLATDAYLVGDCARLAAERVATEIPIVVCPTVTPGFSEHHMDFPGTLTLSMPTFIGVVTDICESLVRHGFRKLLLLNGHGGNQEAIQVVVRQVVARHDVIAAAASYWVVAQEALEAVGVEQVGIVPGHSAGFETSCMLALRPELVHRERMPREDESAPHATDSRCTVKPMGAMTIHHVTKHPESGVWGDPTLVRPELGHTFVDAIVTSLSDLFLAFSRTEGY